MKTFKTHVNKITSKLLIFLLFTSLLPLVGAVTALKMNMESQLLDYRADEINHEIVHFKSALDKYLSFIRLIALDYTLWEDAYINVSHDNIDWINENIINWLPENFEFTYTAIIRKDGSMLSESIDNYLSNNLVELIKDNVHNKVDYISLNNVLFIATISPFLPNIEDVDPSGYLIILKEIDEVFIRDTIPLLDSQTNIIFESKSLVTDFSLNVEEISKLFDEDQLIVQDNLYTYFPITNSKGQDLAYAIVGISADFYIRAINTLHNIQFIIYLLSFGFFIFSFYLVRKHILIPIKYLKNTIRKISLEKKPIPVEIIRNDEIGELVEAFNDLAVEINTYNESLTVLSITDEITSLYNFRYFNTIIDEKINNNISFTMAFLEIDFIKPYTNIFPRAKTEDLIWKISELLKKHLTSKLLAFRIDHSTFAIVTNTYFKDYLINSIKQFQHSISEFNFNGKDLLPTDLIHISAGITDFPEEVNTKEALIKQADNKLYNARHFLNNRIGAYYSVFHDVSLTYENASLKDVFPLAKTLLAILQAMDQYTLCHSEGVAKYAVALGHKMGLHENDIHVLQYGSLLHDIGKIELGSKLLNKIGHLSDEENMLIMNHPTYGANIICSLKPLQPLLPIVIHHHEWYNGMGYPKGLKGDSIPLMARIVTVADAYDSMVTNRPYRSKAKSHEEAILELLRCSGTQFDPEIVRIFISLDN